LRVCELLFERGDLLKREDVGMCVCVCVCVCVKDRERERG
jgi:hypothetical protein